MMFELAFARLVVVDIVEQLTVEVRPFLKGILLAEQARCHVAGNESRLDEQRTAAAHGVNEVCFTLPARHENHAGSQHLVERRLDRLLTVSATMQRLTAGVKRQRTLVLCHVHVQPDVRIGDADVRALAGLLAELIDDGVLYFIRHKLGMTEFLAEHHRIDGECLVQSQVLGPVDFLHFLIHVIGRIGLEVLDRFENTDSCMQLEIGAIHQFLIARERYHTSSNDHISCPQLG